MSLFIVYENNSVSEHWVPFDNFDKSVGSHVKQINVDGEELEYINKHFGKEGWTPSVPFTRTFRKIMRWYGDHAKFIVGNLTQ